MAQSNTDLVDSNRGRSNDGSRWRADDAEQARPEREAAEAEPARDDAHAADPPEQPRENASLQGGDPDLLWQRWWQIQASFVDAPRSAVAEAHAFVSGIVDSLVRQLEEQRSQLEQRWSTGREISTEELRCDLQRYRDFLGRLLSKLDDSKS
jgi:hypothetical protein